jgi:hypothetical protein
MNWRSIALCVINEVEQECKGQSYGALKRRLFEKYPFGERAYFPYKVWCEEQKKSLARHHESPQNTTDGLPLFDAKEETAT